MIVNAGIIDHADPIRNLYKINPAFGRSNDRASVIYATVLGVGGNFIKATHIPTYEVGDCVIYISSDKDYNLKITPWAIIIGSYPGGLETNVEDIDKFKNDEISPLYNNLAKLLGYSKDLDKRGFIHNWSDVSKGTDYIISSSKFAFNMSECEFYLRSKHAGMYINGINHDLSLFGVTHSEEYINKSVKSLIVNKVPFEQTTFYNKLVSSNNDEPKSASDALAKLADYSQGNKKDKSVIRYEQNSPLIGGYKSATTVNNFPINSVEYTNDGVIKLKGINGFIFDKDVDIPLLLPIYNNSINKDESLKTEEDILKSGETTANWTLLNTKTDKTDLWENVSDKGVNGNPAFDVSELEDIPYTANRARIGALPDGSIVLRDAWGSEIRMKDGDIQISAANRITLLGTSDILNISGGVFSTNAVKGIQLGSQEGNVDLVSEKDIIVNAKNQVTIHSDNFINLLSSDISTDSSQFTVDSDDALINAKNQNTLSGYNISILGSNRNVLCCGDSIIDMYKNVVLTVTDTLSIYSNIKVDKGYYKSGKLVNGVSIYKLAMNRNISVSGNFIIDGQIHTNKDITATGMVAANQVAAKQTGLGGSIYGLKYKPKSIDIDGADVDIKDSSNINFNERATRKSWLYNLFPNLNVNKLSRALGSLFKLNNGKVSILNPVFNIGKSKRNIKPASVDISTERRYIYPGEFFWTESGLKTQTPIDIEDLNIKASVSYNGACNLNVEK